MSIELRPMRDDDIDAVCDLINRSRGHDKIDEVLSTQELVEIYDVSYLDMGEDARVADGPEGPIGYAAVDHIPSTARLDRAFVNGCVDPAHRGQGIGRALLGWTVARATERLLAGEHDYRRLIRVDAAEWLEADHRLFRRFGFEPSRWFEELIRPLTDLPPIPAIDGVDIEPWPDGRDEELLRVRNDGFADHWGSAPIDAETWHGVVRGYGARPDLSYIAVDPSSGEVVAICINQVYPDDEAITGRKDGWVQNLATNAQWRGRGIASALIATSLVAFAGDGLSHAMIGVDAESETGANRLYRALGFELLHRSITFELEVSPPSR